jgi:hypothetical protein
MELNHFNSLILYTVLHDFLILTTTNTKLNGIDMGTYIKTILLMGIFIPFLEESIYRSCLMTLLGNLENYRLIVSIIFALSHMSNIYTFEVNSSFKVKILTIISQCFMTFLLGQYLNAQSLGYSIINHMTFNTINLTLLMLGMIIRNYFNSTGPEIIPYQFNFDNEVIFMPKMKRVKSLNSIKTAANYDCINVDTKNFPQNIKEILKIKLYSIVAVKY